MRTVLFLLITHAAAFAGGAVMVYFNFHRLSREIRREVEDVKSIGRNLKEIVDTMTHD